MATKMKIAIGCDHAATELKKKIIEFLKVNKCEVEDLDTHGKYSVDYPDFGRSAALAMAEGRADRGVLIYGTGIGNSIVTNKYPGIRATLCYDLFTARMSRMHNDSNILVLGSLVNRRTACAVHHRDLVDHRVCTRQTSEKA